MIKLPWQEGRQGGGYFKLPIIMTPKLPFDVWIMKFPEDSYIGNHRDPVPGFKHYRANIILRKPISGGDFICDNILIDWPRLKLFRPDRDTHSVSQIWGKKTRWVLSIGWIKK